MNKDFFVAVDFDGTVVMHEWPEIGPEVPHCVEVLKALQEKKGAKIILYTMRGWQAPGRSAEVVRPAGDRPAGSEL